MPAPVEHDDSVAGQRLQYMHVDGCGMPAFLLKRKPQLRERIKSEDALHLDGSRIDPGTDVTCDTCGQPIRLNIEHIQPIRRRVWLERWEAWDGPSPQDRGRP